jgi:hypothetical protein
VVTLQLDRQPQATSSPLAFSVRPWEKYLYHDLDVDLQNET